MTLEGELLSWSLLERGSQPRVWPAEGHLGWRQRLYLHWLLWYTASDLSISSVPEPRSMSSSGLRAQMVMPWNLLLPVFLVKSQQNPLAIQEAQPKPRTLHVASPSKPAEPPTTTLQSRSSRGPGLAHMSTPTPRPRARGPSGSPASPGPGPR